MSPVDWRAPMADPTRLFSPRLVTVFGGSGFLGRYVIRVGTPDDRYSRWIGVEIVRPFLERSSPSPTTLPR